MAMEAGFLWGGGGQKLSPKEVASRRQVAAALAARNTAPKDIGEGIARVGDALLYRAEMGRAAQAEEQGRARAQELFSSIQGGGADISALMGAMADPWVSEDPGMSAVTNALLQREMQKSDPGYQMDLAYRQAQLDQLGKPDWQMITDPVTGDVSRWNSRDPSSTPELFYDATQKPAGFRPLSIEEKASYGIPPDVPAQISADGKVDVLSTGSGVTVNTGDNSGAFRKKADEKAAERYDSIISGGNDATNFIGDLNALAEIGKNLNTGKGAEITGALGPYAEFLGFSIEGLDEAQAYDAIVSRMAPQMRVPGSGASSDFDAKQFLKSLPGLGKTPEGNAIIIETFRAVQERKVAAAQIAQRVMAEEISWQEGDKLISELGDPFTAFNDYRANNGAGIAAPAADEVSAPTSDAEYNALPSGALFRDPDDGQVYRKP